MTFKNPLWILAISLILLNSSVTEAQIRIESNKPNGIFEVGETVRWTIEFDEDVAPTAVQYSIKEGGLTVISEGTLERKGDKATLSHTFRRPGAVLLALQWETSNGEIQKTVGGAIADPEAIQLASERPEDFDSFWDGQIQKLEAIPKLTQIQPIQLPESPEIAYYHLQMKHIDRSKIRGQMAKPKEGKKLPALLIVQWAGVYPLQPEWVIDKAKQGWLVLNINPHDLPIDRETGFYKFQKEGPLKNYPSIDNEDREQSYFLRMYLSCYRAAQYLTERPDWDGETLVVMGASQGGLQSMVTAALHPRMTASLALVPAGFDTMGPSVGRKGGWPHWYTNTENKDAEKVHRTSLYFDVAHFVPRIKCPVLVGIGLLDQTCPPEGIYAGINQLNTKKEVLLLSKSEHQSKEGSQDAYHERADDVWLPQLQAGTFGKE